MPFAAKGKYKCAYCSRSFPRPASLGSHVYRAHPEHRRIGTDKPVSPVRNRTAVVTSRRGKTPDRTEERVHAEPAPALVVKHAIQSSTSPVLPATSSNAALTHLDAAISGLEKEVEADKQDLTRLEALRRGLAKKEELLAALIKDRVKFVGPEETD